MIARLALSLTMLAQVAFAACADDAARDADSTAAPPAAADTTLVDSTAWIAQPSRLGMIRTGMPRTELIGLVGQPTRAGYDAQARCTYIGGTALPRGVMVMVFDSTVVRIDVTEPGVPTAAGVQVGDSEGSVLERYGSQAAVSPHKYSGPQWHYVTVTPPGDAQHRIIFETDGAVVKNYRVGRLPEVEWVEGCS